MKAELIFQNSAWLIIPCLILGVVYAFVLYQKRSSLTKNQNLFLGFLRGFISSLIAFLLINPLFQNRKSIIQKPLVVFGIDNSKSITQSNPGLENTLKQKIAKLIDDLNDKGIQAEFRDFTNKNLSSDELIDKLKFNLNSSNLSKFVSEIKNDFEGQNLTDVVILSDGIINQGFSPTNQKYPFKIHTIGVGDSSSKSDISIVGLSANKIVYLGNKFQVDVDIKAKLQSGKSTTLSISNAQGKVLDQKIVNFKSNEDLINVKFEIEASQAGKQRFKVTAKPNSGELNTINNSKDLIVDVVNGKENVLLLALSPHPDIKAIKNILDNTEQFELTVKYLSEASEADFNNLKFDLLILHQVPDQYSLGSNILSKLLVQQKPTFFILGGQSNISQFNGMQEVLGINSSGNKIDKVNGVINPNFSLFDFNKESNSILNQFHPVSSPFGEYKTNPGVDVLLYQKVGNVETLRPLLAINVNSKRKTAVLSAEGIWSWRLQEFELTDNHNTIDEFILKTLQVISVREDKSKLRVYPIAESFLVDEKVVLETEVYNNLFEKLYDRKIDLTISDEKSKQSKYSYTITKDESRFQLTNLAPGIYQYTAKSSGPSGIESTSGQFIVKESNLEMLETQADFDLLKTISNNSQGKFYILNEIENLTKDLSSVNMPDKIISLEDLQEIINLKFLLFLIILLISIEWIFRKYFGTY